MGAEGDAETPGPGPVPPRYRLHWHVLLVHFPISLFGVAFGFQVLHLFLAAECFTLSSMVTLVAGALTLIPTAATGWFTWKRSYGGASTPLFRRKIVVAVLMLVASAALVGWRLASYSIFAEEPGAAHWLYLAGSALLIAGAALEGYLGGQLRHRD